MDKNKVGSMFNGFLLDLLSTEAVEDEAVEAALEETEFVPELFEEPEDGWSPYDAFMFGLANKVMEDYGLDRESAVEIVLGLANGLAEKKHLLPVPKGEVEVEDLEKWVKAAEKQNFEAVVLGVVEKVMADAIEDTKDDTDEDEPEE